MTVVAKGAIFEIVTDGNTAICMVVNRSDVTAEEGARCAEQMHAAVGHIITKDTAIVGIVFDVSQGPHVFGPKTRATLEGLFRLAETAQKRIAVRVGTAAIQQLQFSSLCRECAPTFGRVYEDEHAERWARGEMA